MLFYSDIDTGEAPQLADVGPPPFKTGDNTLDCGVNPFCAGEIGAETEPMVSIIGPAAFPPRQTTNM